MDSDGKGYVVFRSGNAAESALPIELSLRILLKVRVTVDFVLECVCNVPREGFYGNQKTDSSYIRGKQIAPKSVIELFCLCGK